MHALTSRIALLEKELDIQKRVNIEQELRHQVIFYQKEKIELEVRLRTTASPPRVLDLPITKNTIQIDEVKDYQSSILKLQKTVM